MHMRLLFKQRQSFRFNEKSCVNFLRYYILLVFTHQVREYELSREFDVSASMSRATTTRVNTHDRNHYSVGQAGRHHPNTVLENDVVSNNILPQPASSRASVQSSSRSSKHALLNSIMNKMSKRRLKKNRRGRKMATRKCDHCCQPYFQSQNMKYTKLRVQISAR